MKMKQPLLRILVLVPVFALLFLCAYIYLNGWDTPASQSDAEESPMSQYIADETATQPSAGQTQQIETTEPGEFTQEKPENLPEPVADVAFDDVTETDWFYESVMRAAELGLISGTAESLFEPNAQISRGDFAILTARLKGADLSVYWESGYDDVLDDAYYAAAVAYVTENGYMGGYVDGSFRPQEGVTRAEMATIVCRVTGLAPIEDPSQSIVYSDHESISSWALGYTYAAREAGLMTGNPKNEFLPQEITPRCQAAVLILKCYNLMYNESVGK